ncbi:hypothetical protein L0F63_003203 [Massospora cicadina]|nr:hypothetical protein L0F63_003203 [Massospora cicadina]
MKVNLILGVVIIHAVAGHPVLQRRQSAGIDLAKGIFQVVTSGIQIGTSIFKGISGGGASPGGASTPKPDGKANAMNGMLGMDHENMPGMAQNQGMNPMPNMQGHEGMGQVPSMGTTYGINPMPPGMDHGNMPGMAQNQGMNPMPNMQGHEGAQYGDNLRDEPDAAWNGTHATRYKSDGNYESTGYWSSFYGQLR